MPSLGDFFRIGLGPGFVDPWDRWLQEGIIALRAALGDRWDACYLSGPIWRFSLAPGLAGPLPVLGVLMPSVDRVGRQFPLTLCTQLSDRTDALGTHLAAADLFDTLETIALDALEDSMSRDGLAARLAVLADVPRAGSALLRRVEGGLAVAIDATEDAASATSALAARLARQGLSAPSAWTASVDGRTLALVCEGLPSTGQMRALFDMEAPAWAAPERTEIMA